MIGVKLLTRVTHVCLCVGLQVWVCCSLVCGGVEPGSQ